MTQNYSNMSMVEVAENLMQRKKTPQSFRKIAQEVSELMGLSEDELNAKLARFYADLTLSGKFVNVGGDKWDLKNRQKFEVGDYQLLFDEEDEDEVEEEEIESDVEEDEEETEDEESEDFDEEDDYEEDLDDGHDEI